MDKTVVAKQFLDRIREASILVKIAIINKDTEDYVIEELAKRFDKIITNYPQYLEEVQTRIVGYYEKSGKEAGVTDFIRLVEWYGMYFEKEPKEYFDPNGKYYSLRMSEVISMYLIAKHQC